MSKDSHLQDCVLQELRWQPAVKATHIGVAVESGVVTLSGNVDSVTEKYAAEAAASRVKGVKAVVQAIDVRLPSDSTLTDEKIAAAAVDSLVWDIRIPGDLIKVEVQKGWVRLTGEVDWHYQRDAAEQDIRRLRGIAGLSNLISIRSKVNVDRIGDEIMHALHRSWFFDPQTITVTADDGKVRLSGTARSLREVQIATATAWSAPGVTDVENNIAIG